MTTHAMKLVTIVCEAYAKAAVTKLLRDVGAHGYTLFAGEGDGGITERVEIFLDGEPSNLRVE